MVKEKPRRTATPKMVDYANSISQSLSIGTEFTLDDSLFDVSKFIRTHKKEFEESAKIRLASIRQIDFANTISDICNIGAHFDKNSTHEQISAFIKKYKGVYKQVTWRNSVCGQAISEYAGDIPKESMLFICDNLYGKHGLYAFIGEDEKVLYIGKSFDISQRIPTSYKERGNRKNIKKIMYYINDNMADVNVLEILLIEEYAPALNTDCKTNEKPSMFHSGIDILKDFKEIPYFVSDETEVSA